MPTSVRNGADRLLDNPHQYLPPGNIGLITNHTGLTADGRPLAQALLAAGVQLTMLFGPEHGLGGQVTAGEKVAGGRDATTGLPVYSLYGETLRPPAELLANLSALLYDIQSIGARFYTYNSTMFEALQACAESGIPFIVLDRPDPLTGVYVAGTVLDPEFKSFVGCAEYATRSGMSIAELARFFNGLYARTADLQVIEAANWRRDQWYDQTGLSWVSPSPNIPDLETALVYIGTCAFEGTNLSEGRGTPAPFLTIGAPWINGEQLAAALQELIARQSLAGVSCQATSFTPSGSKHAGSPCEGIRIHVDDRDRFEPFQWGLYLLTTIKQLYPQHFAWRLPVQPGRPYFFDLLLGTDRVRLQIDRGAGVDEIIASEADRLRAFEAQRRQYLLYE